MENKITFDLDKLNAIARPLDDAMRARMEERRRNRHWQSASASIAAKVRRALRTQGITQAQLADTLGITPANVTRYLNGKTNFELKTLIELERALNIHIIDREVIPSQCPIEKPKNKEHIFFISYASTQTADYGVSQPYQEWDEKEMEITAEKLEYYGY